jgi:hypothetical protein
MSISMQTTWTEAFVGIAAWEVELDDGDFSSGVGYQGAGEGGDKVLRNRRQDVDNIVRNLAQHWVRARLV